MYPITNAVGCVMTEETRVKEMAMNIIYYRFVLKCMVRWKSVVKILAHAHM
jgi:hypothetical protein